MEILSVVLRVLKFGSTFCGASKITFSLTKLMNPLMHQLLSVLARLTPLIECGKERNNDDHKYDRIEIILCIFNS